MIVYVHGVITDGFVVRFEVIPTHATSPPIPHPTTAATPVLPSVLFLGLNNDPTFHARGAYEHHYDVNTKH